MDIHFVTFATPSKFGKQNYYADSIRNLIDSAKLFGIEHFHLYTPSTLPVAKHVKEYMEATKDPGYGYYSWKPIIILDLMSKINKGDVIIYHDAGRTEYNFRFKNNINLLVKNVVENYKGVGITHGFFAHKDYCKRDCFINMNCNEQRYWDLLQLGATWQIWQKNDLALRILREWKHYCTDEKGTVTTHDSLHGKLSDSIEYKEHRWDQAIITNIIEKYSEFGIRRIPNPGVWEKDINNFI